ncbi:MAG TPA: DUF3108 domain-containing protein [Nevskia sp.]|nr:DUF3108 domain-containing protein [Nevskia sp.]
MTRPTALAAALALATFAALADAAPETSLPNLDYTYDGDAMGLSLGQVHISLKPEGAAGCYRYTNTSNPSGLVKMLYGSANQASLFCLKDGRIRSQHFESVLDSDPRQSYTLDFDWDKHTVTDNKGQVRSIPDDAIDSFALQQAVRLWVLAHAGDAKPPVAEFTMVDNKNLTHYQFKFSGHQKIDTPAGSFDTLLMERIDNPDKIGRFWLAPDRGYMPVRTETKGGKALVTLVLAK